MPAQHAMLISTLHVLPTHLSHHKDCDNQLDWDHQWVMLNYFYCYKLRKLYNFNYGFFSTLSSIDFFFFFNQSKAYRCFAWAVYGLYKPIILIFILAVRLTHRLCDAFMRNVTLMSKMEESRQELVTKRHLSSRERKHFGFHKDDIEQNQVICRHCLVSAGTTQGNTTNLFGRV